MKRTFYYSVMLVFFSSIPFIYLLLGSETTAADISKDGIKKMVEAVHLADEAFNENNLEKYLSYLTDDFIHDNVSRSPANKDRFAQKIEKFFEAFPGVRNYQKDLLPYENYLVFDECTFEIPVPGKNETFKIFHMDIVEMEDDKLKVKTTFGDGAFMKVALHKIKPPFLKPKPATISVPPPKPLGLSPLETQSEFMTRWNNHDLESLAEMFHENAEILVSPLFSAVGRAEYIGWQEDFFTAFPDVSMSVRRAFGGKDWAISEIQLQGTNTGPYLNDISTGKNIEQRAGYLTRFDKEGAIISLKLFIDSMSLMNQLGLEPVLIE